MWTYAIYILFQVTYMGTPNKFCPTQAICTEQSPVIIGEVTIAHYANPVAFASFCCLSTYLILYSPLAIRAGMATKLLNCAWSFDMNMATLLLCHTPLWFNLVIYHIASRSIVSQEHCALLYQHCVPPCPFLPLTPHFCLAAYYPILGRNKM